MKRSTAVLLAVVAVAAVALWATGLGLGLRAPRALVPESDWLEPRHVGARELEDRDRCLRGAPGADVIVLPAGQACALRARPGSFLSRRALALARSSGVLELTVTPVEGEPIDATLDADTAEGAVPLDRSGATIVVRCRAGSPCAARLR